MWLEAFPRLQRCPEMSEAQGGLREERRWSTAGSHSGPRRPPLRTPTYHSTCDLGLSPVIISSLPNTTLSPAWPHAPGHQKTTFKTKCSSLLESGQQLRSPSRWDPGRLSDPSLSPSLRPRAPSTPPASSAVRADHQFSRSRDLSSGLGGRKQNHVHFSSGKFRARLTPTACAPAVPWVPHFTPRPTLHCVAVRPWGSARLFEDRAILCT